MADSGHLAAAFVLDMLFDMLALLMALRLMNVRIRPVPICFAAFFGAFSALCVSDLRLSGVERMLLWLPLSMLMMRIAGAGKGGTRHSICAGGAMLACLVYLGGMTYALYGALGSLWGAYGLGSAFSAAFFVITLRFQKRKLPLGCVEVVCVIAGKNVRFSAIADTGNSLRDYYTHRPVIVAPMAVLSEKERKRIRLRPIFADTAGGRMMMVLSIPEWTELCVAGKRVKINAALAFSPGMKKGMPALVPAELMDGF